MPELVSDFKPHPLLLNGHVHTIYPAFFRKSDFRFNERERITLFDGDFIDLDWYKIGSPNLVILCHGLEGSSSSSYMLTMGDYFSKRGYDVLAVNYRSCSGEINNKPRFYHHGATDDIHDIVERQTSYNNVHFVGYSLGGNLILKYATDKFNIPLNVRSIVSISAPVDLVSCVDEINKPKNRIYVINFLKSLRKKVKAKATKIPNSISTEFLNEIKTLTHFDTHYTAPIHGFESAKDYYIKSSSINGLETIQYPSLLINSMDDPMLGEKCYPYKLARKSENFHLLVTEHGGHCGFLSTSKNKNWLEKTTFNFIKKFNK